MWKEYFDDLHFRSDGNSLNFPRSGGVVQNKIRREDGDVNEYEI